MTAERPWWPTLNRARHVASSAGLVFGLSYLLKPAQAFATPFYDAPKAIMSMPTWGLVFLISSVLAFAAPWLGRFRQVPLAVLACAWAAYGLPAFVDGLISPNISPGGGWAVMSLAVTALIGIRDTSPSRLTTRKATSTWRFRLKK